MGIPIPLLFDLTAVAQGPIVPGENIITTGLILQELLQGFQGPRQKDRILQYFAALPLLYAGLELPKLIINNAISSDHFPVPVLKREVNTQNIRIENRLACRCVSQ